MSKDPDNESSEGSSNEPIGYKVKKTKVKKKDALWLTSFSDLSLLLMCFFIMQLAYSTPDKRKFEQVKNALQSSMNSKKPLKKVDNLETLSAKINKAIIDKKLQNSVVD